MGGNPNPGGFRGDQSPVMNRATSVSGYAPQFRGGPPGPYGQPGGIAPMQPGGVNHPRPAATMPPQQPSAPVAPHRPSATIAPMGRTGQVPIGRAQPVTGSPGPARAQTLQPGNTPRPTYTSTPTMPANTAFPGGQQQARGGGSQPSSGNVSRANSTSNMRSTLTGSGGAATRTSGTKSKEPGTGEKEKKSGMAALSKMSKKAGKKLDKAVSNFKKKLVCRSLPLSFFFLLTC